MYTKTVTTLAIIAIILLGATGISNVLADDQGTPEQLTVSNSSQVLTLTLENHTYYPDDTVRAFVFNATDPLISVVDPSGNVVDLNPVRLNDSAFMGEYRLDQGIILASYTVSVTDNATGATASDTFEVTTHPVALSPTPEPTAIPANETIARPPLYLYLNVSRPDYHPAEVASVVVTTNAGTPTVAILDPLNNSISAELKKLGNDSYMASFRLDRAVVLGNYTVMAYVNENGVYESTIAYFNVTMGQSMNNGLRIRYAAYDPSQKAIVVRANVDAASANASAVVKNAPIMKGMNVKGVRLLAANGGHGTTAMSPATTADRSVEVTIPVDPNNVDMVTRQFNVTRDITKATTSVAVNANGTNIHLSLNDKIDGDWYRLSAAIPAGYSVQKIVRADGVEIGNDAYVDRATGNVVNADAGWYVDNGTLYFYDDPINGYDITLQPPMASNSLAVNVIDSGQLSAIVYPFNQTDSDTTLAANDHLGRNGDGSYATDIDADAGSKTAVRMYTGNVVSTANLLTIGNQGLNYPSGSSYYTDNGQQVIGFNTVPDGSVESVVISNYRTPSGTGPSYVNITQKTIIRNNNLWFATVYYINNAGSADINGFRFYQGVDFNFNGNFQSDDDFYDAANDIVYGYKNNANSASIHVGGFRSPIWSSMHDESDYGTTWNHIKADTLNNATQSQTGIDGGCAMAWDHAPLKKGETWTMPVIWAVGSTTAAFTSTMNTAVNNNVYDVGIKEISSPANGASVDSTTTPSLTINATAMDVGVTDQTPRVTMDIKNSAGTTIYTASVNKSLSVPYSETAPVSFTWSLAGVQSGTYTINVYTQLTDASGRNIDQNASNNMKTIVVNVRDFTVYPDQSGHVSPGDNIYYTLTLANLGADRSFDLSASSSSAGWPTYLYYRDSSILIASDDNGDGVWDSVNNAYKDPATGLPYISVQSGKSSNVLVQKLVPTSVDTAILDTTVLKANPSGQPLINSTAVLKTDTPFPSLAGKTFYLHAKTLNTTPDITASSSTAVKAIFSMWSQTPAFADNFIVSGKVNVPLYYTTSTASGSMPITVTLFYTNGAGNTVLIGSNTSTLPFSSSVTSYNFAITPTGGNVTVPAGSYLVLKVDNVQTTTLNVYYDSTHKSCVQVNTPTYVHVSSIATYNGATATSAFAPGDTVRVVATVNDPIGAYDIPNARITITAPDGTVIVNNQSMTYVSTDPSNPPLWRSFNYSTTLGVSQAPGVYTVSVTGYESNGVIHTRTTQITVVSLTPAILILPNNSRVSAPNAIWQFKHTVTNLNGARSDVADITATGSLGWTVSLFKADGLTPLQDTDHDGKPDTGTLAPLSSVDIIVQITVPSSASAGSVDTVSVVAASSVNTSITSMVTDTVLIPTTSVVKTLYLHNAASPYLDTSPATSTSDHVDIAKSKSSDWTQTPAFARNFNILDDPTVTLYVLTTDTKANMNVNLISTNGVTQTTIGTLSSYQPAVTNGAVTALTFTVPLSTSNVTIPAGNKLILHIDNLNKNQQLTVYGSSQYLSHIDMDTQSYVNVQTVALTDTGNNPITSATPPTTVRVTANVTDPFGSFDITGATLVVKDSNDTVVYGPVAMAQSSVDPGSPSLWKQYQSNVVLGTSYDTGNYQFIVTANESNGVQHTMGSTLAVAYPMHVSASTTIAPSGGNNFVVTVKLTNLDTHTVKQVRAYDFYSSAFTVSGFSDAHVNTVTVNNAMLTGYINKFGPFDLGAGQTTTITFNAAGTGNYNIADFQVIGVDPDV